MDGVSCGVVCRVDIVQRSSADRQQSRPLRRVSQVARAVSVLQDLPAFGGTCARFSKNLSSLKECAMPTLNAVYMRGIRICFLQAQTSCTVLNLVYFLSRPLRRVSQVALAVAVLRDLPPLGGTCARFPHGHLTSYEVFFCFWTH